MANVRQNKTVRIVKNVVLVLVLLGLIGAVIGLSVKLNRSTSERLGGEAYSIGLIDENGADKEGTTASRTRDAITVKGLKCTLEKDAKIKYELFFYDAAGKFLSKSGDLTADYDGKSIPETAETVRVMITPTEDEDGKVTALEVLGYANLLVVSHEV